MAEDIDFRLDYHILVEGEPKAFLMLPIEPSYCSPSCPS